MQTEDILSAIDDEIKKLQQARALLEGIPSAEQTGKRRGRPKGSIVKAVAVAVKTARRTMSEEGKQRIAAAQKARWTAQKKTANPPAKKAAARKKAKKKATAPKTPPVVPLSPLTGTPTTEV